MRLRAKPKKEKSLLDLMYMAHIKPSMNTHYSSSKKLKEGQEGEVYIHDTGVECQRAKINVYFGIVKDNLHENVTKFIQNELLYGDDCFVDRIVSEIENICDDLVELMTDYDKEAEKVEENVKEIEKWTEIRTKVVNNPLFS